MLISNLWISTTWGEKHINDRFILNVCFGFILSTIKYCSVPNNQEQSDNIVAEGSNADVDNEDSAAKDDSNPVHYASSEILPNAHELSNK